MDILVAKRTPVRGTFTRRYNNLMTAINDDKSTREDVEIKFSSFERIANDLALLDEEIYQLLLDAKSETLSDEYDKIEEYKEKSDIARVKTKIFLENFAINPQNTLSVIPEKTKLKLPKIELVKFSGEVKDWLGFWSQFSRIHDDEFMSDEDKFQYLIQCMVIGSRAKEIVDSYPPSAENYAKVIESLKTRFGRDELLVEYYVRELLTLVIKNAMHTKVKMSVMQLYDKLESYLRSLESIGVTKEKYAAMLFPLVESSIPEDLLRVWLRNPVLCKGDSYGDKLSQLLSFLRAEVEGEERISLARTGFKQSDSSQRKRDKEFELYSPVATANDLFVGTKERTSLMCQFCGKSSHDSKDCFKGQKLPLEEKTNILRKNKCCFSCLKSGHLSKNCKANVRCVICGKKHWVIMCSDVGKKNSETKPKETVESTLFNQSHSEVFLQTLLVRLSFRGKEKVVRALVDTGSQRSYILSNTAKEMKYTPLSKEKLTQVVFGGHTSRKEYMCYKVLLRSLHNNYSVEIQALEQPIICGPVPRLESRNSSKIAQRIGIQLVDVGYGQPPIELLIGSDFAGMLYTGKIEQLERGLFAVQTRLGWMIMGKTVSCPREVSYGSTLTSLLLQSNNIADLWKLESIGITDPCETQSRREMETAVQEHFKETVCIDEEGRYTVRLPWKYDQEELPTNREIAKKRLFNTTSKLQKEGTFVEYDKVFKDWQDEKIIAETSLDGGHFFPHRGVFKMHSTTPVRPVFDASAKLKGKLSLNDCLEKGPNLLQLIPAILLKFREKKIGVISDIKKAFLQISIDVRDRQFLKFLWWEDESRKTIKAFQHCRVVFGLTCSPYLLGAVIQHHLTRYASTHHFEVAEKLRDVFYVDNCVTSVDTETELVNFIQSSTKLMAEAKFDLRGWEHSSLSPGFLKCDPTPVLGLLWDKEKDCLFCDTRRFNRPEGSVTRRIILSVVQQIFDPLGLVCPVTLCPKMMLQQSWKSKLSWDAEVPEEVSKAFLKWFDELKWLTEVKIPRWVNFTAALKISLHTFCDASAISYAAAVFLRCEVGQNVSVQLLVAKSRISPLKTITIPRLELMACCIGARLTDFLKQNMKDYTFDEYYWTDSSTALYWITHDEQWAVFVKNRVEEIRKLTKQHNWRHIPGQANPADLPSRGCTAKRLVESRWWEGPSWLKLSKEEWPRSDVSVKEEEIFQERKRTVAVSTEKETPWYCRSFSSFLKIVRTIAWMKRFGSNARNLVSDRNVSDLTVMEIEKAETILLRLIQREAFGSIKMDALKILHPKLDEDGLIRTVTRLVQRQDTDCFKKPVVLPSKHPVVKLLILEEHRNMSHAGVQTLMTHLREKYWILQCRRTVRQALKDCRNCRRFHASRTEVVPAPLPENRVRDAAVFQIIGIDLGGPLYLRTGEKAWFVLFTCAVIRAVHIELVLSLSTDSFLLAFRRFVARRGRPHVVYSDNGTNLVGANNALQSINWETIKGIALVQRIQWNFIPPTAAWWGGWWERLIGLIKDVLRRVLGKARLDHDELVTVLCEAESVINHRPLTYLSEDAEDLQPLTPSLFLQEVRDSCVTDFEVLDSANVNKRYRYRQKLKEDLRKRFRTEYLGQLRHYSGNKCPTTLQIGQIVLVGSDNSKRVTWPLAKVLELFPGKDGNIRVARLKTMHGEILRPLQRLYPMEIISNTSDDLKVVQKESGINGKKESNPKDSKEALPNITVEPAQLRTRSGRLIKVPSRFQDFEL